MENLMNLFIELLEEPLVTLFVVLAIGAPLGKLKLFGANLGIASVLFAGLGLGAISPKINLPSIIYEFGLVLFIYCIGISSGEQFFRHLKNKGWRDNVLALGVLVLAFLFMVVVSHLTDFKTNYLAGLFAGSITNTPALASILETIRHYAPVGQLNALLAEPVVAYSVCYPMGVIGTIAAIILFQKAARVSLKDNQTAEKITNAVVELSEEISGKTIASLVKEFNLSIVFGRVKRGAVSFIAKGDVPLLSGDLISIVGKPEELERAIPLLGKRSLPIVTEHGQVEMRRIFVSNPAIIGQSLRDLNLMHTMGCVITRIRRGDDEVVPSADTTLHFGDRVRVLAPKNELNEASKFFGDSYAAQSHVDILTLGIGVAAGFFLGKIPIPISENITLRLGIAGGPLIVALILGSVNRVGKLSFVMPYSANNTISQLGLVLFLAGVGTRSGYAFRETITQGTLGLNLFLIGGCLTFCVAFLFLFFGNLFLKVPYSRLAGMLSGFHTQPAVLAFVNDQAKNGQPNVGYASTYPIATLGKIILAQLILSLL